MRAFRLPEVRQLYAKRDYLFLQVSAHSGDVAAGLSAFREWLQGNLPVRMVSPPLTTVDGTAIYVEAPALDKSDFSLLLERMTLELTSSGVQSGTITRADPNRGPFRALGNFPHSAYLQVVYPKQQPIPNSYDFQTPLPPETLPELVAQAVDWVRSDASGESIIETVAGAVCVAPEISIKSFLEFFWEKKHSCTAVARQTDNSYRAVQVSSILTPEIVLVVATSVPSVLPALWNQMLTDGLFLTQHCSYAASDSDDTWEWVTNGIIKGGSPSDQHADFYLIGDVLDHLVLDGYIYQVLGTKHLERLGDIPGLRTIGNDRYELRVGNVEDWLAEPSRSTRQAEARQLLAPCILTELEARAFFDELYVAHQANKREKTES